MFCCLTFKSLVEKKCGDYIPVSKYIVSPIFLEEFTKNKHVFVYSQYADHLQKYSSSNVFFRIKAETAYWPFRSHFIRLICSAEGTGNFDKKG